MCKYRSVEDYETDEDLENALLIQWTELSFGEDGSGSVEVRTQVCEEECEEEEKPQQSLDGDEGDDEENKLPDDDDGDDGEKKNAKKSDWMLTNYDPETTIAPTVDRECERLRALSNYMVLDAKPESAFDEFTERAMVEFDVPIALVSLVDLGRQWFLSNAGSLNGVCSETSRDVAFCAHAVAQRDRYGVFEVRDATKDVRFRDNPIVTGPPNIRFYAGAPLVSPQGCSLGTFCIIDTKPRPDGLSDEQQKRLKSLAAETVVRMERRRERLESQGLKPRTRRGGRRPVNIPPPAATPAATACC